jgi:two-component system, cell cycle sensor histidine kinase and response regulator CckA
MVMGRDLEASRGTNVNGGWNDRLRILLVDDSSSDLDLMERELQEWGLDCECVQARGRREFLDRIAGPPVDLVITDYVLPDLDGLEVLRLVKERNPLMPVIVVTGAVDERTASDCIREGAADYVLKDHLLRLPIAALNALEGARAKAELSQSEKNYRLLVEHLPVVAFSLSLQPSLRLTFVSRRVEHVLGFPPSRWLEERGFLWSRIHFHDRRMVLSVIRRARDRGGLRELTFRFMDAEDRVRWVRVQASPVLSNGGSRSLLQGVLRDITEQKEAEFERDLLFAAVEQSDSMVIITDIDGNTLYANQAVEAITGYGRDEILGRSPRILLGGGAGGSENSAMWEALRLGEGWQQEFKNLRKDGTPFVSRATLSPILDHQGRVFRILGIFQDITAHKEMETELRQIQKMETVGQLSGGIAHDMNNILTAVTNFTSLARAGLEPGQASVHEDLEQVEAAARRGAELIRKLMTFSRREELRFETVDAGMVVLDLREMLARTLPANIVITVDATEGEASCWADAGALEQILMNLATNARDALPDGGDLRIEVGPVLVSAVPAGASRKCEPGPFVRIRVQDSGPGMGDDVRERIFEPFFTTKPRGKGTGLGLTIVSRLVHEHGGFLTVESSPQVGTTMSVHLPVEAPSGRVMAVKGVGLEEVLLPGFPARRRS